MKPRLFSLDKLSQLGLEEVFQNFYGALDGFGSSPKSRRKARELCDGATVLLKRVGIFPKIPMLPAKRSLVVGGIDGDENKAISLSYMRPVPSQMMQGGLLNRALYDVFLAQMHIRDKGKPSFVYSVVRNPAVNIGGKGRRSFMEPMSAGVDGKLIEYYDSDMYRRRRRG